VIALVALAVCVGCGPRLLRLNFSSMQVHAAAPAPPPPPPPPAPKMKVMVAEKMIQITERVEFEVNKAEILPASHELLDQVVEVLKKHTEIELVEVQGHTDNTGRAAKNKRLSQARAASVKKYLVDKGIDAKRLLAKGYGQSKPLVDNDTDENKQKNRRVEFHILKKAEKKEGGAS
jgi:OOP family OmpA-OmpF porin